MRTVSEKQFIEMISLLSQFSELKNGVDLILKGLKGEESDDSRITQK